ncbi:MAG: STAS domain-containing protein [Streptosporangiaceae bacterium]
MAYRQHGALQAPSITSGPDTQLAIRPLPQRRGLVLTGNADIRSQPALHDALRRELDGGADDVHLELADLRFIDVCCAREILTATERFPQAHLVLHHPPAVLVRIATWCGWRALSA